MVRNDVDGVSHREAALLMRSHKLQNMGDACLTDGLNPGDKYRAPVLDSHEYGWRVATKSNGMFLSTPAYSMNRTLPICRRVFLSAF